MRFIVHEVAMGQDCLRVFRCAPVGIIAPAAVARRTSGRNFTQSSAVLHCIEQCYRHLIAG